MRKDVATSVEWPSVEGKVIKSELSPSTFARRRGGVNYSPNIRYSYTVNGRKLTSNRIMFGGVMAGRASKMQKYIERYPEDSIVKIYYDPTNPESAVLEPNVNDASFYYAVASFLALCSTTFIVNYFTGFGDGVLDFFERSN